MEPRLGHGLEALNEGIDFLQARLGHFQEGLAIHGVWELSGLSGRAPTAVDCSVWSPLGEVQEAGKDESRGRG